MTLRLFIPIIMYWLVSSIHFGNDIKMNIQTFRAERDSIFQKHGVSLGKDIPIISEPYFLKDKGFHTDYRVSHKSKHGLFINYTNKKISSHRGILFVQFGRKLVVKQKIDLEDLQLQEVFVELGTLDERNFDIGVYFVSKERNGKLMINDIRIEEDL